MGSPIGLLVDKKYVGEFKWDITSLVPETGGDIILHLTGGDYKAEYNYNSTSYGDGYTAPCISVSQYNLRSNYIGNYGYTDNQYYTSAMIGQPPLLTVTYKCVKPVYKLHVIFPDFLDPNSSQFITPSHWIDENGNEIGNPYARVSVQLTEQCSIDQK
ncbi:MAG: hypothetical protein ACP5PT_06430, partial [Brevinematia bacterium]